MTHKMFKILLMGAMLAALVGLLACGGSADPEAPATAEPEATAPPTAVSVAPTEASVAPAGGPAPTTETMIAGPRGPPWARVAPRRRT